MTGLTAPIPNKKRLVLALDNEAALIAAKVAPTQLVRLKDSEKLYRIRTGAKVKSSDVELNSGKIAELIDHDHNGLYYTQAQVDQLINAVNQAISDNTTAINTKAAGSHTHDERYYTESEVDRKLADVVANGVQLSNSYTGNRTSVATTEKALSDGLATKAESNHNHLLLTEDIGSYQIFKVVGTTSWISPNSLLSGTNLRRTNFKSDGTLYEPLPDWQGGAISGSWRSLENTGYMEKNRAYLFQRVA